MTTTAKAKKPTKLEAAYPYTVRPSTNPGAFTKYLRFPNADAAKAECANRNVTGYMGISNWAVYDLDVTKVL